MNDKIKSILSHIVLYLRDITEVANIYASMGYIKRSRVQELIDTLIDTFIYPTDNQIKTALDAIERDKFKAYILNIAKNMMVSTNSKFNYKKKEYYLTKKFDDIYSDFDVIPLTDNDTCHKDKPCIGDILIILAEISDTERIGKNQGWFLKEVITEVYINGTSINKLAARYKINKSTFRAQVNKFKYYLIKKLREKQMICD